MKDVKPPRGMMYWTAGVFAVAALALSWWPWPAGSVTWQPFVILLLVAVSGVLMRLNLAGESAVSRRENLVHILLVAGVVLLPLGGDDYQLPGYFSVLSIICLVASFALNWRLRRDKRAAGKEMAPSDR
ncbi:MAG: hypothetical protein WA952_14840 [Lewinella sp.]